MRRYKSKYLLFILGTIVICILGLKNIAFFENVLFNTLTNEYSIENYYKEKRDKRLNGYAKAEMPEQMALIQKQLRTPIDKSSPEYGDNYLIKEYKEAARKKKKTKSGDITFIERGPSNVAGRTRAILVYSLDSTQNTWLAASASGGIWKTTNAGQSWEHLTKELPNLGTNTLANSPAAPDVVYAGTGEHFTRDMDGAGMFKSIDFGQTWQQIADPEGYPDFRNISRIIVDPNDADHVVVTTRNSVWADSLSSAVYKTTDGGVSWVRTLSSTTERYDDLDYNPKNFNTQYIAVLNQGVLKSTDAGLTWKSKSLGMQPGGRVEIDISTIDTSWIWASAQGEQSGTGSDLYISKDGAETWKLAIHNDVDENIDFLGGQGWYDNIILAHPFNLNEVYVGGVDLWKFTLGSKEFERVTFDLKELGTQSFMSFVNGNFIGGGVDFGNIPESQLKSVAIRFGIGTQKAHRFTVNGRGAGVPARDYMYNDYVEVPFQVWDTDNNKQLMVSFRDQQGDSIWNLLSLNTSLPSSDDSREYIFIHDVEYNISPDTLIAKNGAHEYRNMYFMWPYLTNGAEFDLSALPNSTLRIEKLNVKGIERTNTNISDSYNRYSRINTFASANFANNKGMHPDQHFIVPIVDTGKYFRLLVGNDGGVYLSKKSLKPGESNDDFIYSGFGYNTTQFYSADKAPGKDRYIGGMQDNSTWYTPNGVSPVDKTTKYQFAFGGDGFEVLWNNRDDRLILGSVQFNSFRRSDNGGQSWRGATSGLTDVGQGNGPFISRLANSKEYPDRVFTLGSVGVWKSENFGLSWSSIALGNLWSFNNSADVEVSLADYSVVWAGGALEPGQRLFVSTDGGDTFRPTNYYDKIDMGLVSGLATHPTDLNTAYALFSFSGRPKILKTSDLGQNWIDISGFEGSIDGKSSRGFPDVAVNTLFVFPNDTLTIWAGTEIGIVESMNGGETWNLLDGGLEAVNIYDFMLQDDQLVIATYGRGIWTASVEGLTNNVVFAPVVVSSSTSPKGNISINVHFNEEFDSSDIFLNSNKISDIGKNNTGVVTIELNEGIVEGQNIVQIVSRIGSNTYQSNAFQFNGFMPGEPVEEYFNDFNEIEKSKDFIGVGFEVRFESGFFNNAIHTPHPYSDNIDITYVLKTPIRINGEQILSYDDVAIVETGEPGTVFGQVDFYDYVIVESSLDGETWTPLIEGYDASFDSSWLNAYENDLNGSSQLFISHRINLSEFHDQGDIIFIRFRLSADEGLSSWGWGIDNIIIAKENTTATIDINTTAISIFPNPASNYLEVIHDKSLKYNMLELINVEGMVINRQPIVDNYESRVDLINVSSGIYFIRLYNNKDQTIHKIMVSK